MGDKITVIDAPVRVIIRDAPVRVTVRTGSGARTADAISIAPIVGIASNNVQGALEEIRADIGTGRWTSGPVAPLAPAVNDVWVDTN